MLLSGNRAVIVPHCHNFSSAFYESHILRVPRSRRDDLNILTFMLVLKLAYHNPCTIIHVYDLIPDVIILYDTEEIKAVAV